VFDSLNAARAAASRCSEPMLLCGETKCLPPEGFHLGNSPGAYVSAMVRGKALFLSTTNGTRALVAARQAPFLFTGALVNASAIAVTLAKLGRDITLLCAGTDGEEAPEDLVGAGAVISEIPPRTPVALNDSAHAAQNLFRKLHGSHFAHHQLVLFLAATQGGKNVVQAGLYDDITFAGRVNAFDVVPRCDGSSMTIRPFAE
jgi:2-phosphosulfolactate phosphatase